MSSEFFQMGGYALYVWGSFGAGLAVFVWNWIAPWRRRRELIRSLTDVESAS